MRTTTAPTCQGARANGRRSTATATQVVARRRATCGVARWSAQVAQAIATMGARGNDGSIWMMPICCPVKPSPCRYTAKNGRYVPTFP